MGPLAVGFMKCARSRAATARLPVHAAVAKEPRYHPHRTMLGAADVSEGQSRRRCCTSGALGWRCAYGNRGRSSAVARTSASIVGISGPREPLGICKGAFAGGGRAGHSLGLGDPRGTRQAGGAAHDGRGVGGCRHRRHRDQPGPRHSERGGASTSDRLDARGDPLQRARLANPRSSIGILPATRRRSDAQVGIRKGRTR